MTQGHFIVIEGPNGAGKSSHFIPNLVSFFSSSGFKVSLYSEPSNSKIGDLVREYREDPTYNYVLACLLSADRYNNQITIENARRAGEVCISDRHVPSSFVYQILDNVSERFLKEINYKVLQPDLTIFLMPDLKVLEERLINRKSNTHSENLVRLRSEVDRYEELVLQYEIANHSHLVVREDVKDWTQFGRSIQKILAERVVNSTGE